ncbi:MAG: hypothetical protein E6J12_03270 [Chloroflexi bacterium]|nr:MAG: hypothetical protein E6J12_03270 [Chloroflexota bacterium]
MGSHGLFARQALVAVVSALLAVGSGGLAAMPALADSGPQISISDVTQAEGNSGTTNFVFTVSLGYKPNIEVDVNFTTSDGSATYPSDYQRVNGTLAFSPGQTTKTVAVPVVGDTIPEGNQYFSVNLSSAINGNIVDSTGQGTIVEDDPAPYISIGNATVIEGDSGTTVAALPVTLSTISAQPVSVHYYTSGGSAQSPRDFVQTQGTLTIAPGDTSATVNVTVNGDTNIESNESFTVNLNNAANANIGNSSGTGYILNDDITPTLTLNSPALYEGNSGNTNATFTITLQPASTTTASVTYATSDGSATAANNDYVPTFGTLVFSPGQTGKTVNVPVVGDTTAESDEFFTLNLGSPKNAVLLASSASAEIQNDDPSQSGSHFLQIGDAAQLETDSGTNNMTFTVTLSPASTSTVTVTYATADNQAVSPSDYTATSGTLTFNAGQTSKTVMVAIVGDTVVEGDENFNVNLSSPSGATLLRSQATGHIINNDYNPTISVSYPAVIEGNAGTTSMDFVVSLSSTSANTVQVNYATADNSAIAGSDYSATSGPLTFSPGQTSKTVSVLVNGDNVRESNESLNLNLSGAVNGTIANQGTGYIVNDDQYPTLSVGDASVYEGQTGTTKAAFKVSLSSVGPNTVTVNYSTAAGMTSQTVNVTVNGDTTLENNEVFYLNLSTPAFADIVNNSGQGTIINDDWNPVMSIGDTSVLEGNTGNVNAVFPVTLSMASFNTITVHYATSDGSASAASDYVGASGDLTFNPGDVSKTVSVAVHGDTLIENDEYFTVTLGPVVNASAPRNTGTGYILNDDGNPSLSVNSTAITEGNAGSTNQVFTVKLQPSSPNTVTVNYATSDGSAQATSDYTATSGTLTFNPGDTSKQVLVPVSGDTTVENNEYFALNLSSLTNAHLTTSTGYGYIVNDDAGGQAATTYVSVDDATVVEGNSGTTNATFNVTMAPASASTVTVNYSTADSSAVEGFDYESQVGTITFSPGQTAKTVVIAVDGNTIDQSDRVYSLNLSGVSNATLSSSSGTGTILDDDTSSRIFVGDATVVEPNSGTTQAVFNVNLTAASAQPVLVDYNTAASSASPTSDYNDVAGTLLFNPGDISKTVSVTVNGDNLIEGTEVFSLNLTSAANAVISNSSGTGTIFDLDIFTDLGVVAAGDGTAVAGVSMKITGNNMPTVTLPTAGDGSFLFPTLPDGTYTVTPTLAGYTFFPAKATVLIRGAGVTGTNFLALTGLFIEGLAADGTGKALAGVTISRTGNAQSTVVSTTNSLGYYGFSSNPTGTYTVTATKTGYTFDPASFSPTVGPGSSSNNDFVGVKPVYIIGRVVNGSGTGVAGVTVTRSGGGQPAAVVKTDSQGYYGFSQNPSSVGGITYTITPSATGHTFSPIVETT